jgi:hypothetical protein
MTEARLKIILNNEDVRKIEKAGDVSLDENQQLELVQHLEWFVEFQRQSFVARSAGKKGKRHLEGFIKRVSKLHDSLKDLLLIIHNPNKITDRESLALIYKTAFQYSDIELKDFLSQLSRLKSRSAYLREQMAKDGRPSEENVSNLLSDLADVYQCAGGASIEVSRFNRRRTSKFIDFAWEAISHLPKLVKQPLTKDALAARWEKERSLVDKTEPQNIT